MIKNRCNTERKIIDATVQIIDNEGFEGLNIAKVARMAEVSKMLVYRYFDSLAGLIKRVIEANDFWGQIPDDVSLDDTAAGRIKDIFHHKALILKNNPMVRKFYRWGIMVDNDVTKSLKSEREVAAWQNFRKYCNELNISGEEALAFATFVDNSIIMTMIKLDMPQKRGLDISTEDGWKLYLKTVDDLIDNWIISRKSLNL
ncbi:MAG: TetR/AcrR family transcriptional regulator [Bacteroidales bacterium]|nr:TetR/AcrR family transcriptional regulator [Bacteroidales bacterium]